jgi:SAM-dependent methyltransferase
VIASLLNLPGDGEGVRLLDVGSGQGDLAAWIHARYPAAEILGLELSESGVKISKRKMPAGTFVQRNLLEDEDVPAEHRGWATHAVCSEVIEHVDDPRTLLQNARAYMAPGCKLIVTAPGGPMSLFDKHIGHRKHFRPTDVRTLLAQAGYEPKWSSGAGFPFFNLYRLVVIARGKKLIEDVRTQGDKPVSSLAKIVMRVFGLLFRFNVRSSRWGWQMVAEGRTSN